MTTTYTTSSTFTRTHARYLASKIAADLFQMQLFYGRPNDKEIEDYLDEAVILLLSGCLDSVTYGFRRGDGWVIALQYTASVHGLVANDDRSGGVTPGVDISGTNWGSFLCYSSKWSNLLREERLELMALLPISRAGGAEPKTSGAWTPDRSYSNGGVALQRRSFAQS